MKYFLSIILVTIAIAGVCIISCPKHEEQSKAIMKEINNIIDNEISNKAENDNEKAMALLATTLYSGISEFIIDRKLSVENYFLFSVGKITFEGETKTISLGILNHVFTGLNEEITNKLSNL